VVVSQRSSELKWFSASGRFLRSLGRRGRGPQEFGRTLYVFEGAADTVIVHDADNRRFHYLSPVGKFARLDSAGPRDRQVWVFDRSVVERVPLAADRERLKSALLRIPFASGAILRQVLVGRSGLLLVRGGFAPSEVHSVHDSEGRPLGTLTLPPRFELYQVYDSLVLGRYRDADDFEYIQLRRLQRPRPAPGTAVPVARPGYDQAVELAGHRAEVGQLRAIARNLLTGQELHYSKQGRYAGSLEELGSAAPPRPPGVTLELVGVDAQSYWIVVSHAAVHVVCVVGIGSAVSFGYVEACG